MARGVDDPRVNGGSRPSEGKGVLEGYTGQLKGGLLGF